MVDEELVIDDRRVSKLEDEVEPPLETRSTWPGACRCAVFGVTARVEAADIESVEVETVERVVSSLGADRPIRERLVCLIGEARIGLSFNLSDLLDVLPLYKPADLSVNSSSFSTLPSSSFISISQKIKNSTHFIFTSLLASPRSIPLSWEAVTPSPTTRDRIVLNPSAVENLVI
jgi:hypothetical protein